MPREKAVATAPGEDTKVIPLTEEEETARDAEEAEWEAGAGERAIESVREKRRAEYPSAGDVIDALFKKEAGDSAEWDALASAREAVKAAYPMSS